MLELTKSRLSAGSMLISTWRLRSHWIYSWMLPRNQGRAGKEQYPVSSGDVESRGYKDPEQCVYEIQKSVVVRLHGG